MFPAVDVGAHHLLDPLFKKNPLIKVLIITKNPFPTCDNYNYKNLLENAVA